METRSDRSLLAQTLPWTASRVSLTITSGHSLSLARNEGRLLRYNLVVQKSCVDSTETSPWSKMIVSKGYNKHIETSSPCLNRVFQI